MALSTENKEKVQQLVSEGKQIAKIQRANFPDTDYWEIYFAAMDVGIRSIVGVKKMIAVRLNALIKIDDEARRKEIVLELQRLTWDMYERLKSNQTKLEKWAKWYQAGEKNAG